MGGPRSRERKGERNTVEIIKSRTAIDTGLHLPYAVFGRCRIA